MLATGLGKTWLAAFDSCRPEFESVLFVAHREEILEQARETFRKLRPGASTGLYNGKEKARGSNFLFASVQTLSQPGRLSSFSPKAYDYLVIDEFHHASAKTYRAVIDHFEPKFLLGLTATPERMDGGDLLSLCGETLVYRCDLARGIELGLLAPFHYFGVPDSVDYTKIRWSNRRGQFDPKALDQALSTRERAEKSFEEWSLRKGTKTIAFCSSINHARYMHDFFREKGIKVAAVFSQPGGDERDWALAALASGEIEVICCVDVFNEGVDLPSVDTVLMLRPTESRTIWLQQLGRGLRKVGDKILKVIDFIGNHQVFLVKLQALLGTGARPSEMLCQLERAQRGEMTLPIGCNVTYSLEAVDILRGLLATKDRRGWTVEPDEELGASPSVYDRERKIVAGDRELDEFYAQHLTLYGRRPTALESWHEGFDFDFDGWLEMLRGAPGVDPEERQEVSMNEDFLRMIFDTKMQASYKMIVLQVMAQLGRLPGAAKADELVDPFFKIAMRSAQLRSDLGAALRSRTKLLSSLKKSPLKYLSNGREAKFFSYHADVFSTRPEVSACNGEALCGLVRELTEWKLAKFIHK